jgi:hypothetical protein
MCTVSAAMNYLFLSSLGKSALEGQVLGAASAAADILKALLPFFIAWSWKARRFVAVVAGSAAFAFFAGFSFLSAIGFAADNRLVLLDRRDTAISAYARVQRDVASLEGQRSALPLHRPAVVVDEEIESYRQNRRWIATKECREATEPQSRAYCTGYFTLRAELAAAQEAARLNVAIAALQSQADALRQSGAGNERDPQVSLLSRVFGQPQEPVRLALIIAVALLVEIGASLGLFLASWHGASGEADEQEPLPAPSPELASVEDFCLEALVSCHTAIVTAQELQQAYHRWCGQSGRTALPPDKLKSVFSELAEAVGIPRVPNGWRGIALKHDNAALDVVS